MWVWVAQNLCILLRGNGLIFAKQSFRYKSIWIRRSCNYIMDVWSISWRAWQGHAHFNLTVLLRKLLQKNGAILQYLFSFSSPDYWAAIYMISVRLIIIFLSHNSDYYIIFYRFWWMTYITQVIDSLEMTTRT